MADETNNEDFEERASSPMQPLQSDFPTGLIDGYYSSHAEPISQYVRANGVNTSFDHTLRAEEQNC